MRSPRIDLEVVKPLRVVLCAVACLAFAACNSTTRLRAGAAPVRDGATLRTGADAQTGGLDTTALPETTDPAGGTAGTSGAGGAGADTKAVAPKPAAAPNSALNGSVKIGFGYPKNLSAAYAAFGANNLTGDDWKTYIEPIVSWINTHGGIGGRAVTAVYHSTDPTAGTFQSQAEQACTAFTQDDKVFAVIGTVLADNEVDCLAKSGTPFLAQTAVLFDHTMYDRYPGLVFQPFMISAERLGVWIDTLFAQGYFAASAKVGLVEMDTGVYHHFTNDVIKPHLSAHGVKLADEVAFNAPDSAAGVGALFTQASNAVLRFKAEGINHVILSPTGGAIPFVFMPSANSQNYNPRYALNSLEVPAFVTQNAPAEQLHNSIGLGWLPASDLFYKEIAHGTNPAEDLCYAITRRNGDEVKRYCDGLFFLKAALDKSPVFTAAGLKAAVDTLGTSYDSPWTFGTRFGPGRYDGARQARPLAFVDACTCYRYTGGLIDVP
ncbi:MAG TPA: hypothetical protein VHC63_08210 [Acidimicrobiales bacterium]|nr:hypothetical protein [Acidimicrobiales bacterium]